MSEGFPSPKQLFEDSREVCLASLQCSFLQFSLGCSDSLTPSSAIRDFDDEATSKHGLQVVGEGLAMMEMSLFYSRCEQWLLLHHDEALPVLLLEVLETTMA
ncbi:unnamed protein product [Lepeophtheirus salmonis]|uniref:(salmon louse) hypothetical protein n=1 Tax=Lepeophtheirus salmonis TaxID=72036 RepID=A0A7R8CJH6_LEPSM|nr:unnamed protein product [Lepeophtheirus salmonis]CAF2841952.1 unnamed protein product [Lepeophtheirus salmonis]